jgi:hypothetical protein
LYYYYKNDIDEDSNTFDDNNFGIIFKYIKNLLKYIKYQKNIIAAQSREISVRPYLNVYSEIKHCQEKKSHKIDNIYQVKASDNRREFEIEI